MGFLQVKPGDYTLLVTTEAFLLSLSPLKGDFQPSRSSWLEEFGGTLWSYRSSALLCRDISCLLFSSCDASHTLTLSPSSIFIHLNPHLFIFCMERRVMGCWLSGSPRLLHVMSFLHSKGQFLQSKAGMRRKVIGPLITCLNQSSEQRLAYWYILTDIRAIKDRHGLSDEA